jgi:hypothetical protein
MSDNAAWDAARGCWVLGEQASSQRYVVFSWNGKVRLAAEISSLGKVRDGRSYFNGTILPPGHEVFDKYVGKKSPVQNVRNPVTYFTSPLDALGDLCQCDCGKLAPKGRSFLPGHDQTALHNRVKQIGTVADFIKWFDIVRG